MSEEKTYKKSTVSKLVETVEKAIELGHWQVDGSCDPDGFLRNLNDDNNKIYEISNGDELNCFLSAIMRELDQGERNALANMLKNRSEPREYDFYKYLSQVVGRAVLNDLSGKKDIIDMAKIMKYWYTQLGYADSYDEKHMKDIRKNWENILSKKESA